MGINFLAVIICGIVFMVLGFIWYSPSLFGKTYMNLAKTGKKKSSKKEMNQTHFLGFVGSLIFAYIMATMFTFYEGVTAFTGAIHGLMIGLGFLAVVGMIDYMYAQRPGKLYLINYGFYVVLSVIFGIILGGM